MQATDALWHIANFFAPALIVAILAASACKWLWRRELQGINWLRLVLWPALAMATVSALGLVVFERDGKMVTYAAMVVACALTLWWAGFRRSGR